MDASSGTTHLFVYGTLRPGDVRWHLLEPFVVDEGWADRAIGQVFDTGRGYPSAMFGPGDAPTTEVPGAGMVIGQTYALLESSLGRCLEVLDAEEGTVGGDYRRISITTERGTQAWAYEYGGGLELTPITSGDWLNP